MVQESIDLDTNNGDITDSLFGVSVFDNSADGSADKIFGKGADKYYIFLMRYAGNAYDEESILKFRDLYFDAAAYLAGIK